jgi:hypothetical protein
LRAGKRLALSACRLRQSDDPIMLRYWTYRWPIRNLNSGWAFRRFFMKKITLAIAALTVLAAGTAAEAKPPKFRASCPTGIDVKANNQGRVRINGKDAKIKEYGSDQWDASHGGVTISFGIQGNSLQVMYTGKGGANGVCQVTSYEAGQASGASGPAIPSGDEEACLKAVQQQTNNPAVATLETNTSEANNTVIVGVGPQKARWKCLVKSGTVAQVMSLTNEGTN